MKTLRDSRVWIDGWWVRIRARVGVLSVSCCRSRTALTTCWPTAMTLRPCFLDTASAGWCPAVSVFSAAVSTLTHLPTFTSFIHSWAKRAKVLLFSTKFRKALVRLGMVTENDLLVKELYSKHTGYKLWIVHQVFISMKWHFTLHYII